MIRMSKEKDKKPFYPRIKRGLDVFISIFALLLIWPILHSILPICTARTVRTVPVRCAICWVLCWVWMRPI